MKQHIDSIEDLQLWVDDFLSTLVPLEKHATIIALSGDLGAGKTALVKCAAQYYGVSEEVTSPTFVIQKEYTLPQENRFSRLVHIDAYRLNSYSELEYLKWKETVSDPQTIIFIEWPEMVKGISLPSLRSISIDIKKGDKRVITLSDEVVY